MIAFCGVHCSECPAHIATRAGDREALEQVLVQWRTCFRDAHITLQDIICDGCQTEDGRLNGYCQQCSIRPCAKGRGVPTCAHCEEYACGELERLLTKCDRQEGVFGFSRKARTTLGALRMGLAT
jgi:hypothetical protein